MVTIKAEGSSSSSSGGSGGSGGGSNNSACQHRQCLTVDKVHASGGANLWDDTATEVPKRCSLPLKPARGLATDAERSRVAATEASAGLTTDASSTEQSGKQASHT
jgi:hypothetical protein